MSEQRTIEQVLDSRTEIWRERNRLQRERMEYQRKAMAEFDKDYYAALRALRERCRGVGHERGNFHNNGLGWTWFYCNLCGARMEIEGPDGEKEPHDE